MPESSVASIMQNLMEANGDKIEYRSFMAHMIDETALHEGVHLWDIFRKLDTNGDGFLSRDELPGLMEACRFDSSKTEALLAELDTDGDGLVSFEEFRTAAISDPQRPHE